MGTVTAPEKIIECRNFIAGEWQVGSGEAFDIESPWFGKVVGKAQRASSEDIDAAVMAAKKAQEQWAATPIKERSSVLLKFRQQLVDHIDAISHQVALENGKLIPEARAGVLKGIEVLDYALSVQNADLGGRLEVSRSVYCEYRRQPLGVVANITPFNFPAMVPMWTIPNVLVTGNAYIWKPSDKTPLASLMIADCLQSSGIPRGLFSVLQGGRDTVEGIIDHPDVKAIGFVGSSKVAEAVYRRGTALGKRILALGGAKNHIVLLPDAEKELTGKGISDSFTGCGGQRCMAASVLLAVGDSGHHIEQILQRASSLKLGQDMGAIITGEQLAFLEQSITKAEKDGARILLDGRQCEKPSEYDGGYWIGPTILDQVKPDSQAAREELFGPILSIVRCKNISEAMAIENANPYGNACSVFTSSGPLADKVLQNARAGMLGVNIGVPVPREPFSFGGIGLSKFGHGDITGGSSLDFWTDLQKITTKWESQPDENWMS